jgi:hypothetical protein
MEVVAMSAFVEVGSLGAVSWWQGLGGSGFVSEDAFKDSGNGEGIVLSGAIEYFAPGGKGKGGAGEIAEKGALQPIEEVNHFLGERTRNEGRARKGSGRRYLAMSINGKVQMAAGKGEMDGIPGTGQPEGGAGFRGCFPGSHAIGDQDIGKFAHGTSRARGLALLPLSSGNFPGEVGAAIADSKQDMGKGFLDGSIEGGDMPKFAVFDGFIANQEIPGVVDVDAAKGFVGLPRGAGRIDVTEKNLVKLAIRGALRSLFPGSQLLGYQQFQQFIGAAFAG